MRRAVGKTVRVYPGEDVRIHVRLSKGVDYARYSIWSSCDDTTYSPHIQISKASIVKDGRPILSAPMYGSISREVVNKKLVHFIAEEDLYVRILEEVDDRESPASIKVRVTRRTVRMQQILSFFSKITSSINLSKKVTANV